MSTSTSADLTAGEAEPLAGPPDTPDPQAGPDLGPVMLFGQGERRDPPQIETLARDLGDLTAQNRQLIQGVGRLLDLYEAEKAQRQALQSSLERIVEEIAAGPSAAGSEALATTVRQAVSDDLKPLLHAILDLLEITMRRTPLDIMASSEPAPPEAGDASEPGEAEALEPADDLPRDLPEILKKSVEELMGTSGPKRQKAGEPKPASARRRRSVLDDEDRSGAWIPVTSDTA